MFTGHGTVLRSLSINVLRARTSGAFQRSLGTRCFTVGSGTNGFDRHHNYYSDLGFKVSRDKFADITISEIKQAC